MLSKAEAGEEDKERRIDLSEIIGLPDFDVSDSTGELGLTGHFIHWSCPVSSL
jgi:hypothetical protein